MKPTKAKITMFFILLLTLALVRGYGDLINHGVGYFNVQITGSLDELMNDESATRTVNPDGTVNVSKTNTMSPDEIKNLDRTAKLRFAFIMAAFVFFFVLIYLLAVVSVALVNRFDEKNQSRD